MKVVFRTDIGSNGEFLDCQLGDLREVLNHPFFADKEDFTLIPVETGNFAVTSPAPERYYVGYIDLALGTFVGYDGDPETLDQLAANYPFDRDGLRRVRREDLTHAAVRAEIDGKPNP